VCISLMQEDIRMSQGQKKQEYHIGFSVFKSSDGRARKARAAASEQICKSGQFTQKREVLCEWNLQPGHYIIVPSTFDPRLECNFTVVIYANKQCGASYIAPDGHVEDSTGTPLDRVTDHLSDQTLTPPHDPVHGPPQQPNAFTQAYAYKPGMPGPSIAPSIGQPSMAPMIGPGGAYGMQQGGYPGQQPMMGGGMMGGQGFQGGFAGGVANQRAPGMGPGLYSAPQQQQAYGGPQQPYGQPYGQYGAPGFY